MCVCVCGGGGAGVGGLAVHRTQFEHFLKDFFDEYERHLAENFCAFCVIL